VNDESYYWPDLLRGMIVDGETGQNVAKYLPARRQVNRVTTQSAPISVPSRGK
jgi:hypothetical protein